MLVHVQLGVAMKYAPISFHSEVNYHNFVCCVSEKDMQNIHLFDITDEIHIGK